MKAIVKRINSKLKYIISQNTITTSKDAIITAACFEISPEAKGRFFLVGCALSDSISTRSFITYIELEARQKTRKANSV
jgi:hypothetical protein